MPNSFGRLRFGLSPLGNSPVGNSANVSDTVSISESISEGLHRQISLSDLVTILDVVSIAAKQPRPVQTSLPPLGAYGSDPYGSSPYGSDYPLFGVQSAVALNGFSVLLKFSDLLDFTLSFILTPSNYTFDNGLTAQSVAILASDSVLIHTDRQQGLLYTVTVGAALSYFGVPMDPSLNSATFTGAAVSAAFFAVAVQPTKVRLIFNELLLNNSALTDPTSYTISDFNGNLVAVSSVTLEQPSPISLFLTLPTPLHSGGSYEVTVSSNVRAAFDNSAILPPTAIFTWFDSPKTLDLPLDLFSGEIHGGLFGNPAGLVYFSPALNIPTSNSIIQIDEVDVCTTASDIYTFPQPIDPPPLFTYSPTGPPSSLGPPNVLWGPWPRLSDAKFILSNTGAERTDAVPVPTDGSVTILFQEPWDPSRVALLNNPAWSLFDSNTLQFNGAGSLGQIVLGQSFLGESATLSVPPVFITADNLSPIPPGPVRMQVLNQALVANSQLTGSLNEHLAIGATPSGDSHVIATLGS